MTSSAAWRTDPLVTRRSFCSSGGSTPRSAAAALRSSSSSTSSRRTARRCERVSAGSWRKGRSAFVSSSPSARRAASSAGSGPSAFALVTRTCAFSPRMRSGDDATSAPRKSTTATWTPPSSSMTLTCSASSWPWVMPAAWSRLAASHSSSTIVASRLWSSRSSHRVPTGRSTSSASSRVVTPAVTTVSVRTPACAASSVTKPSFATWCAPSEPDRRTGFAVPDRPPQRREELGVVGIASVHLHDERLAVGVFAPSRRRALPADGRPRRASARRHRAAPVRPRRQRGSGCLRTIRRSGARPLPRSWRSAHRRSRRSASSPRGCTADTAARRDEPHSEAPGGSTEVGPAP